ncbi:MAG: nodulation protein NfeD [Salinivirgaceae bacterium]|jgi:membrane-bound serine protease (ClpP class)|nr:nodulation protein NfeD [Salinivirgaceae bacterium]
MKKLLFVFILLGILFSESNAQQQDTTIILKFDMKENVAPALWRKTQKAFEKANEIEADLVLIHMNTYGGMVVSADSIRTKILNSDIPVYVFIDNNAASAGALISVACDKIFMRPGANIGAATVVNQTGEQMPDKYQSYMRSTMRATAEAQGKDTIINSTDTTYKWKRNPAIAEAMVDADLYVKGISDTGKVITFTTNEAIKYGFCEGIVDNIKELIEKEALNPSVIIEYNPPPLEKAMGLLVNPVFQSLLIMVIFGGLYFELQTPGIGFPLGAAVLAAILYFAPLYLEGIAENWEIALFITGLLLIGVEIFAIPGFGVAGISGITLAVVGLSLAMVDTFHFEAEGIDAFAGLLFRSLLLVLGSLFVSLIGSILLSQRMFASSFIGRKITLKTSQPTNEGYSSVENLHNLVGKIGIAETILRPSGTVIIEGEPHDAKAQFGYIEKGTSVKVTKYETSQIYVIKTENTNNTDNT